MKKILSFVLALILTLLLLTLPASAEGKRPVIYIDVASFGWEDAKHIGVSFLYCQTRAFDIHSAWTDMKDVKDGIVEVDLSDCMDLIDDPYAGRYGIVLTCQSKGQASYLLTMDSSCLEDTVYTDGSTYNYNLLSYSNPFVAYWRNQDRTVNGPAIIIESGGNVYGECFYYPAENILSFYLWTAKNNYLHGKTEKEIIDYATSIALKLGLTSDDVIPILKEAGYTITEEYTPPVFDNTPTGQFKHFLYYQLDGARKSGKSDQEILDEKAEELGLLPYQIYTCLEDLGMKDQVNWDFKLWYGIQPTFKGQFFPFGLTGSLSDIPGEITGSVTYNSKGLRLAEGLKEYPVSGINFAPATEEYGSLYDVSYTFSEGRVDYSYTLKDKAAAEAFFGIGHNATDDEVGQTRLRMTLVKGAVEMIAGEGRYDLVSCEIEIKDTNGNWLYKDHQSTVSGYGIQGFMPIGFVPSPEDYIDYEPTFILGDADSDGIVTVMDATAIQKYKAELITEEKIDLKAADADQDGIVTVMDATRIQKYKAKLMNMDGSVPYRES